MVEEKQEGAYFAPPPPSGKKGLKLGSHSVVFVGIFKRIQLQEQQIILASLSFWPLLIIELVPRSVPAPLIIR